MNNPLNVQRRVQEEQMRTDRLVDIKGTKTEGAARTSIVGPFLEPAGRRSGS